MADNQANTLIWRMTFGGIEEVVSAQVRPAGFAGMRSLHLRSSGLVCRLPPFRYSGERDERNRRTRSWDLT
jgi:hypothetical protein